MVFLNIIRVMPMDTLPLVLTIAIARVPRSKPRVA